jgi:outer membrane lipoprotein-sorting protein
VPAAVAAAVVVVVPALHAVTASAHGSLPPRTAAQLLADVRAAKVKALSGTVVETTDLGLPELPSLGGEGPNAADFSSLVSGSHTMRVWYAGPEHLRLALLGQLGESDLVRNGSDVWAWSSRSNEATHWTVPAERTPTLTAPSPSDTAMTPQQAAEAALRAIDPSTKVVTDPTAEVAGRPAYQLDLVPRDSRTLVGSVRIAIDGATHVPTRVQVFARGAAHPAFQVGFTSLSTSTPDASVFGFTPPPGATVKQVSPPRESPRGEHAGRMPAGSGPRVFGRDWTSVVVAHLPSDGTGSTGPTGGNGLGPVLRAMPEVSGSWGTGHLLRSPLFSVVLTDDGRVAVGAVPPAMLYRALDRA